MLQGIGRPGNTWNDVLEILNNEHMDQAMVQFMRAITAMQMWAKQPEHEELMGIDQYRCAVSLDALSRMLRCLQAGILPALGSTPNPCDHHMHMLHTKLQN